MSKKVSCFRELGGIACQNGSKVKEGVLFRSGHLGKLSEKAAADFTSAHNIRHIVDLRSNSEVKDVPELSGSAEYHRFTPLDDNLNPSVTRKTRLKILKRLMAKEGGTLKHLCDTYRKMVTLPEALAAYRSLLRLLLKGEGALWHCTQGKDRTGIGSVVILLALGVEREVILDDYLAYNRYRRFKNGAIYVAVTLLKLSTHMSSQLNNLMTAQREYLLSAFDEIDTRYGGTEGFLTNALGLSGEEILKLRDLYLA